MPARGWLDALGSSSAPELRMIPGPPPAINGKHMTTTVASRHAKIGVERPSTPHAHTGESGATPGAALTPGPRLLPFTNLRGRCVAAELYAALVAAGVVATVPLGPARPGDHLGTAGRLVTTVDPRLASALGSPQHT